MNLRRFATVVDEHVPVPVDPGGVGIVGAVGDVGHHATPARGMYTPRRRTISRAMPGQSAAADTSRDACAIASWHVSTLRAQCRAASQIAAHLRGSASSS
ncbi:Uncharacterised protein [Mycobacterium tuberculosis]|nr:Uncharacterised protein [Mycobacterium tuberculosis]